MSIRLASMGSGRLNLRVGPNTYLFGHRRPGIASGDYSAFAVPALGAPLLIPGALPEDVHAVAIAEDSEVRGVRVNGVHVVEGSPVELFAQRGAQLTLDRLDYTDGALSLVLLTKKCPTLFLALPTLVRDFARVDVSATVPGTATGLGYVERYVQAPRIRGVRHVAAVYRAYHDGNDGGAVTVAARWPNDFDGAVSSDPRVPFPQVASRLVEDGGWSPASDANIVSPWDGSTDPGLVTLACPAPVALFRFVSADVNPIRAVATVGWCAP